MTIIPFNPEHFLYAAIGDVHGDLPAPSRTPTCCHT